MAEEDKPGAALVALRDARERAINLLSEAFAHDLIGIDEFERRLTAAHRADSLAEIARTTADLAEEPEAAPAPAPVHLALPETVPEDHAVAAIFGGVERRGTWTLPRRLQAVAVFGGIVLDFREALLLPGVSEVRVFAMMGGIQIIVPPNLPVEVSGTAIMGGFGHVERTPPRPDADRPLLRIHGVAVMGGVAVETRLPGESETDAHRRRRAGAPALAGRDALKQLPEKAGR